MSRYFFSRLSINMEPDYIKKLEYLYGILINGKSVMFRKDNYKVMNVNINKIGVKSFITGTIIKYSPVHTEKVLTEENIIEDVVLKNHILASTRFIIDANESMFIYQENKSHIPNKTLATRFLEILSENSVEPLKEIEITPITDSYSFLERIKRITEIKKIVIKLHPSNPNNRDKWQKIDEKLKKDNITDYKEIQENKTAGESIIVDEETIAKIQMGEDGYGVTKADGFDSNGEWLSLSTSSSETQAKADVEEREDIEEEIQELQAKTQELKIKPDGDVV